MKRRRPEIFLFFLFATSTPLKIKNEKTKTPRSKSRIKFSLSGAPKQPLHLVRRRGPCGRRRLGLPEGPEPGELHGDARRLGRRHLGLELDLDLDPGRDAGVAVFCVWCFRSSFLLSMKGMKRKGKWEGDDRKKKTKARKKKRKTKRKAK